jgi:GTP cyclohydrolase I
MSVAPFAPVASAEERAADAVSDLLAALGEDPGRDGLRRTPARVARALAYLTSGRHREPREVLNDAVFEEEYDGVVLVRDVEFYSLCEHHLLPFHGVAHIGYQAAGRVVGLSKLPRLLEIYARRLQVQERLTRQVAEALDDLLRPRGVAVAVEASHLCMRMRGVEKERSLTMTTAFLGSFRDSAALRAEFLAALGRRGRTGAGSRRRRPEVIGSIDPCASSRSWRTDGGRR